MRIVRSADFTALPWKNGLGVSRVIAADPPDAGYDKVEWQVGTTDIGIDCPFSSLPGMDRQFMLLNGAGVELHCIDVVAGVDVRHAVDKPFVPVDFRGDWQTTCRLLGEPVQVFNVMTRRGRASARIAQMRWTGALFLEQKPGESVVAVLLAGAAQVTGDAAPLMPMESVVLNAPQGELREVITSGGPARLAIVRVTPVAGLIGA
jgi:environmental stress-induced protein Ves